jgi:hypothetical protein
MIAATSFRLSADADTTQLRETPSPSKPGEHLHLNQTFAGSSSHSASHSAFQPLPTTLPHHNVSPPAHTARPTRAMFGGTIVRMYQVHVGYLWSIFRNMHISHYEPSTSASIPRLGRRKAAVMAEPFVPFTISHVAIISPAFWSPPAGSQSPREIIALSPSAWHGS